MQHIKDIEVAENQLNIARRIAKEAHEGQVRWNDDPYYTHPERVAKKFYVDATCYSSKYTYPEIIGLYERGAVAFLHDVLEDCEGWTTNRLIEEGILPHLAWSVTILTKLPGETYLPYILRLKRAGDPIAYAVKVADIHDNLSDLHVYDNTGKFVDRYQMALYILENNDTSNS